MNSHDFARKLLSFPECEMLAHAKDDTYVASYFEFWSIDYYGCIEYCLGSGTENSSPEVFTTAERVGILLK